MEAFLLHLFEQALCGAVATEEACGEAIQAGGGVFFYGGVGGAELHIGGEELLAFGEQDAVVEAGDEVEVGLAFGVAQFFRYGWFFDDDFCGHVFEAGEGDVYAAVEMAGGGGFVGAFGYGIVVAHGAQVDSVWRKPCSHQKIGDFFHFFEGKEEGVAVVIQRVGMGCEQEVELWVGVHELQQAPEFLEVVGAEGAALFFEVEGFEVEIGEAFFVFFGFELLEHVRKEQGLGIAALLAACFGEEGEVEVEATGSARAGRGEKGLVACGREVEISVVVGGVEFEAEVVGFRPAGEQVVEHGAHDVEAAEAVFGLVGAEVEGTAIAGEKGRALVVGGVDLGPEILGRCPGAVAQLGDVEVEAAVSAFAARSKEQDGIREPEGVGIAGGGLHGALEAQGEERAAAVGYLPKGIYKNLSAVSGISLEEIKQFSIGREAHGDVVACAVEQAAEGLGSAPAGGLQLGVKHVAELFAIGVGFAFFVALSAQRARSGGGEVEQFFVFGVREGAQFVTRAVEDVAHVLDKGASGLSLQVNACGAAEQVVAHARAAGVVIGGMAQEIFVSLSGFFELPERLERAPEVQPVAQGDFFEVLLHLAKAPDSFCHISGKVTTLIEFLLQSCFTRLGLGALGEQGEGCLVLASLEQSFALFAKSIGLLGVQAGGEEQKEEQDNSRHSLRCLGRQAGGPPPVEFCGLA